ncbi:hypothetical protein [uncultured Sphingomonas sp.]|uniref:hypothetical protein n=1 Tax=uncultured Sphingomonas sp. TaxID=158754 RepID=UPI0025FA7D08|nr:hypothetical protein [uncultured Sphingomonas sp.]
MSDPIAPPMLVIGRGLDGAWTVSEAAGALLGRFKSNASAAHFARRQQRLQPSTSIANAPAPRPRLHGRLSVATTPARKDRDDA